MSPAARRSARRPVRPPGAVMILAAYPKRAAAERAARALIRARLLACATVTAGGRAFYRWKGREHLWGKTTRAKARAAIRAIKEDHPDQVPEILVLPILGGHAPYLAWLAAEVRAR